MRIEKDQLRLLVCMGALIALFVLVAWLPQSRRLQTLQARIADAQLRLGMTHSETHDLSDLANQVAQMRQAVSVAQRYVPTESELADLLRGLSRQLDEQQLADKELQTRAIVRGADYSVMPVALRFRGGFHAVYAFLHELEDMPRLIRLDRLAIRSHRERGGLLEVQLELSAFFSDPKEMQP